MNYTQFFEKHPNKRGDIIYAEKNGVIKIDAAMRQPVYILVGLAGNCFIVRCLGEEEPHYYSTISEMVEGVCTLGHEILWRQLNEEFDAIAEDCAAEGLPSRGSTYDLRCGVEVDMCREDFPAFI